MHLKYEFGIWLGNRETLYFALAKLHSLIIKHDEMTRVLADQNTSIVIEGYPRSANTFAVVAFAMAQGWDPRLRIAHHYHSPAQIIRGVRLRKSVIVLIRKPDDAITSFVIRHPSISLHQALRAYIVFYSTVLSYKNDIVLAIFEEITSNYGNVIRKVNERYGTSFRLFAHARGAIDECFRLIEERNRQRFSKGNVSEESVARPSESRRGMKLALQEQLLRPGARGLLQRATDVYNRAIA